MKDVIRTRNETLTITLWMHTHLHALILFGRFASGGEKK